MNWHQLLNESQVACNAAPWMDSRDSFLRLTFSEDLKHPPPWHLWLDKFAGEFSSRLDLAREIGRQSHDRRLERLAAGKTAALRRAVELANESGILAEAFQRKRVWLESLERQVNARQPHCFVNVPLVNTARLLVHLGRASVLENVGLYADHATGLPWIPGTAVKGVVSTWAFWQGNAENGDQSEQPAVFRERWADSRRDLFPHTAEDAPSILGDDEAGGSAGGVIFLGGFPVAPPKLELDLVNPHHDASGRQQDPTPSVFLAVAKLTPWEFPLLAPARVANPEDILKKAAAWLVEALSCVGLGAKTAAGYGRFAQQAVHAPPFKQPAGNASQLKAEEQRDVPSYESYAAKTKDWTKAAAELPQRPEWEQSYIVAFFSMPEGRALAAKWSPAKPATMARLANLRNGGWEEEV